MVRGEGQWGSGPWSRVSGKGQQTVHSAECWLQPGETVSTAGEVLTSLQRGRGWGGKLEVLEIENQIERERPPPLLLRPLTLVTGLNAQDFTITEFFTPRWSLQEWKAWSDLRPCRQVDCRDVKIPQHCLRSQALG